MAHYEKLKLSQALGPDVDIGEPAEFLSSHPSHDTRAEYLESMLQETIELREKCGCPRLPRMNPIERVKRKIEEEEKKKPQLYTLITVN